MGSGTLTAGILGLNASGVRMLEAASQVPALAVKAIADRDQQKVERLATRHNCQAYTDFRQLIVQNQFDCLLVAAETHTCDEHLRTALKKRFHVLKLVPPARRFEEAFEYSELARSANAQFVVANPARYAASYRIAHDLMGEGQLEHISLLTAYCSVGTGDRPAWYADPKLAGGGVLMHECYRIIDQILWNFPLPQQVYALNTNQAPDKQQRLYLTEDTSVLSLRFTDALLGSVVATRCHEVGPELDRLQIYGRDALLTVGPHHVTLTTGHGRDSQHWQDRESEKTVMQRLLTEFAEGVLNPTGGAPPGGIAENLKNMAVLESAYLSARTGFPEEPARILQLGRAPTGRATSI
jgi:predicted dehydrogenase